MAKTFKVSIAGGIDAVTDTAFGDGKHVAYMENLDLRGGKASPINQPLLNLNMGVPAGAIQVYAYRGQVIFSTARRDYTAEYLDNRQRIYWTQYGGNPMKMIDTTVVPLGTIAPSSPPGVAKGPYVSPQGIQAVVSTGGGLAQGSNVSLRLAYQTAFGILPPSGSAQVAVGANSSLLTLTWSNPVLDTPATAILVFLGVSGGDERFLTILSPGATSYIYLNPMTASGALASDYDQQAKYAYCTTYTRNVNGVLDESGPSSVTPFIQSVASRTITFNPWAEGILASANTVTWTSPFTLQTASALLGYSSNNGTSNALGVTSITSETGTNRVLVTFAGNHHFYDGQKIYFQGLSANPFVRTVNVSAANLVPGLSYTIVTAGAVGAPPLTDWTLCGAANNNIGTVFTCSVAGFGNGIASYTQNMPVEIEVDSPSISNPSQPPMLQTCYLKLGASFVPPGSGLIGASAFAVPSVGVASLKYMPDAGVIQVVTSNPHSFNRESILVTGAVDNGWNNQLVPVKGDPNNADIFYVEAKAMPSDTAFGTWSCALPVLAVTLPSGWTQTGAPQPIIGDVLYFNNLTVGTGNPPVQQAAAVLATPTNGFLLNLSIPGVTSSTGPTYTSGIQHVPFNDYLQFRNLYRTGGTTNFQQVKQLPLDQLTFQDAMPDQGLGAVIPTLYTDSTGVDIVVEPAPFGLAGLIMHNKSGFAFDPASNRVRWSLQGMLDAWPPEYYEDFEDRVLALCSFNAACCVFAEDGVHRGDGPDASLMNWSKTKADPCRAGGSVQKLGNRVIYLSDEGLVAFDGQESTTLTDLVIPGDFWLANSRYLNGSDPQCYLVPAMQNAAYPRLRGTDPNAPANLTPYMVTRTTQLDGIRSFVKYGKYYLYWGGDHPEFSAQTMLCVDFSAPGRPIVSIGVKALDAFVDELETVHMLLQVPTTGGGWVLD